jgi:hypothetical protein
MVLLSMSTFRSVQFGGLLSGCRLPDPGGSRLVTVPPGVMPGAGKDVAVIAKRAPVVRWRVPLPDPYRQGVSFELVDVVDCVSRAGVETALYLLARPGTERPLVTDDLDSRDPLIVLLSEIDALNQEEAALHPLVGDRPPHLAGDLPGAEQPAAQLFEIR